MDRAEEQRILAAAIRRRDRLALNKAFDANDPESRPTENQLKVIKDLEHISHRYVTAGNQSGKSQLGARETAWIFEENHPYWNRPKKWGDQALTLLVIGQTRTNIENSLWPKIEAFLDKGTYQVKKTGSTMESVTHKENGNKIIFLVHSANEQSRKNLQGFVAHYAWVDEMPVNYKIIEEIHRRVQAANGYFLATFTPKVRNDAIRKLVDSGKAPVSRRYKFSMFDNPVYAGREHEIIESMKTYSEEYRNCLLYGEWTSGDLAVYQFNSDAMVEAPIGYHPSWRHVESVDPAMTSKSGYTLWAEDPSSGVWYCVKAEYLGPVYAPREAVNLVMKAGQGNIARRVSDNEPWFIGMASEYGLTYMQVFDKIRRKNELIKNLQTALSDGKIKIAPWCTDLIEEFSSCRWSETQENKIVNSQSYHLLDSAQYFNDVKPAPNPDAAPMNHYERIHHNWIKGKQEAAKKQERQKLSRGRRWARR